MKEIGVLMKPDLAQAAHDGAKTKTRRVIDPQPFFCNGAYQWEVSHYMNNELNHCYDKQSFDDYLIEHCKYGKPGDLIYIKEAHYAYGTWWRDGYTESGREKWSFEDQTSSNPVLFPNNPPQKICELKYKSLDSGYYKRNSLFMPKKHVRTWAKIMDIRVEYLNAITRSEIVKEGVCTAGEFPFMDKWIDLWDSINADRGYSWDSNPWVWVIEFERIDYAKE